MNTTIKTDLGYIKEFLEDDLIFTPNIDEAKRIPMKSSKDMFYKTKAIMNIRNYKTCSIISTIR